MSKANQPRYCGTITNPTESGCWIVRSEWRRGEKTIERDKQTFDSPQAAAEYAAELEQRHAPEKEKSGWLSMLPTTRIKKQQIKQRQYE